MEKITSKKCVVIPIDDPAPVAYLNVYEEGDIWVKIRGCDECPLEDRLYCCGNCSMLLKDTGECRLHLEENRTDKPIYCIMKPFPDNAKGRCVLEFKCIHGKNKGKIRRLRDKQPLLYDETTGKTS